MADVILKLVIDGKEFDAKIKDADKQINNLKKDVQKSAADMTSSLKGVASAMGLAFGAATVINFMKSSIESFAQQEASLNKLKIALGKNTDELNNYASALQKKTAFADEEIVESMARIAMFTKEESQIKRLVDVTLDFAAAKGMDLVSATDAVVRTFNGEMDSLTRIKLNLNGAAGSQERLNSLVSEMTRLFGGQAGAQLDTTAGKIANMKNKLDDVSEAVGEKLIPVVTSLMSKLDAMLTVGEKIGKSEFLMALVKLGASPLFIGSGSKIDEQLNQIKRMYEMQGMKVGPGNIMDAINQANQNKNILFQVPNQIIPPPKKTDKDPVKELQYAGDALNEIEATAKRVQLITGGRGIPGLLYPSEQTPGAKGGTATMKEMSESTKQVMGVVNDTTDAMWRNLIIGGRQAADEWDAIWLTFRNSALQRIGEIVEAQIWDFLFNSIFSIFTGSPIGLPGNPASAVIAGPVSNSMVINPKLKVNLDAKLIGEDIYLSNKRVSQRKTSNSL